MQNPDMGRQETLTLKEASAILEVEYASVRRLARMGFLRQVPGGGRRGPRYVADEVTALKEAKRKYGTARFQRGAFAGVAQIAEQALAAARAAQQRVEALERLLGCHVPPSLVLDDDGLVSIWDRAHQDSQRILRGADSLNYWADTFISLCDQCFVRLEALGTKDPWGIFFRLSTKLVSDLDLHEASMDVEELLAIRRLHAARTHLRHAIFMYLLQRYGQKTAVRIFPSEFRGQQHDILCFALDDGS